MAAWQLPRTDWTELLDGLPQAKQLTSRYGTTFGTVLIWAEATQSDYLLCPLLSAPRTAGIDPTSLIDKVSRTLTPAHRKGARLELLHRIADYASTLGMQCDKRHGTNPSEVVHRGGGLGRVAGAIAAPAP
ncbi:hypothetical protein [Streptomyces sp. NPDC001833]|uniref:hypothetical protein n=1 Tax=Streptomyces sp. NPDC001833 TaxID=3154658 RepID=UPI0033245381